MPSSTRLVGFLCALAAPLCRSVGELAFRSVLVVALCITDTFVLHVLAMMNTTVTNVLVVQSTSPPLVAVGLRIGARQAAQPA
jgi:hypothetical protein